MINLTLYVANHTDRGECKCGKCFDTGSKPDPQGHTVDMVFFLVSKLGAPTLEEFKKQTSAWKGVYVDYDPFDGQEHNYIDLGAWIGDQALALQYMALGTLLGGFELLTPKTVLGLEGRPAMQMAMMGMVSIQAKNVGAEVNAVQK